MIKQKLLKFVTVRNSAIAMAIGMAMAPFVSSAQIFTAPTTGAVESAVGPFAIWIFGVLLIVTLLFAGLMIGGMFSAKLKNTVVGAVRTAIGGRRRGRGRRR